MRFRVRVQEEELPARTGGRLARRRLASHLSRELLLPPDLPASSFFVFLFLHCLNFRKLQVVDKNNGQRPGDRFWPRAVCWGPCAVWRGLLLSLYRELVLYLCSCVVLVKSRALLAPSLLCSNAPISF